MSDTWERLEWYALTNESVRSDVTTLLKYKDGFGSVSPTYLFWELYRPSLLHNDESKGSAPKLSGEVKDLVLDVLGDMFQRHRVPYEPDQGVSSIREHFRAMEESELGDAGLINCPDNLKNLLVHIHVAGARAFVLKQYEGYSEVVVDCLKEVDRSWKLLSLSGYLGSSSGHDADNYEVFHSIDAISALSLVELARVDRNQGLYAEALHKMAEAEGRYESASVLVMGPLDRWPLGGSPSDLQPLAIIHEFLTGMHTPPEYVLETFNLLKSSEYDGDWTQIARDCERLAGACFLSFPKDPTDLQGDDEDEDEHGAYWAISEECVCPEEPRWAGGVIAGDYWEISQTLMDRTPIADGQSNTVTWYRFWLIAHGWALAQLSPSEYRKMRDEDAQSAAEARLKNYFFGNDWPHLPERAKRRLINADLIWNSPQRVSRESILNDLLRVAEEMCERFIFQQFMNEKKTALQILSIETMVAENEFRSSLDVNDFIAICELPSLRDVLTERKLRDEEVEFLTQTLPTVLRQLNTARGGAEHEIGMSATPDSPQSFYRGFLGIGRPGILPELARIGRKLQSQSPRP